jgi:hypothetical protein
MDLNGNDFDDNEAHDDLNSRIPDSFGSSKVNRARRTPVCNQMSRISTMKIQMSFLVVNCAKFEAAHPLRLCLADVSSPPLYSKLPFRKYPILLSQPRTQ